MGLFGLFASIVGLGAMAKDGISRSISESEAHECAVRDGSSYYYTGNGAQTNSTKTGRRCTTGFENGHRIVRDFYTGEFIEDVTLTKNKRKEVEEIRENPSYCVFHRKCDWDTVAHKCDVWVSNEIPGYFYHLKSNNRCYTSGVDEFSRFCKGELIDYGSKTSGYKKVQFPFNNDGEQYFADGTKYSDEEMERRELALVKQLYKEGGYKFYPTKDYHAVGQPIKFNQNRIPCCSHWKDVDTDEMYKYDYKEKSFVKQIPYEHMVNMAKPHHKPIYEKKTYYRTNPKAEKLNSDGTKWYP